MSRAQGLALPLFAESERAELRAQIDRLLDRMAGTREAVDGFFAAVEPRGERHAIYGARERYRSASELLGRDLAPLEALLGECAAYASGLNRLAGAIGSLPRRGDEGGGIEAELQAELEQGASMWTALGSDLEHVAEGANREWVYWRTALGRGVELRAAPVTVGEHARRLVLGRARAAVLTSATLAADGDFRFTAERLGLGEAHGLPYHAVSYPSPFPLAEQMRVWVVPARRGATDEADEIAEMVAALASTGRNQLVLFTAHERLRRVRERLRGRLAPEQLLLAQEWDGPASRVSERFRKLRGAVLLEVQSLWEGVDFPGEALEILVVAKLPFSVPDDPMVEARGERLREQGLDPFRDDAVPEAVLRFRQGVGRLIRRADDRGVLVVCDPRLATASYRRPFLSALPVAPIAAGEPRALAREAAAFLEVAAADEAAQPAGPPGDVA